MNLSMWILLDWLKKYNPKSNIISGKQTLKNVRVLSSSNHLKSSTVYITLEKYNSYEKIIIINNKDMIYINNSNIDDIFNDILEAFEYYSNWYFNIKSSISNGFPLENIIHSSENIFKNTLLICDYTYEVTFISSYDSISFSNELGEYILKNKSLPLNIIVKINSKLKDLSNHYHSYLLKFEDFPKKSLYKNLIYEENHIGWIVYIEDKHKITKGIMQLCDILGDLIVYWFSVNKNSGYLKTETDMFKDIIENNESSNHLLNKLTIMDWKPNDVKYLIKINCLEDNFDIIKPLYRLLKESYPNCFITTYNVSIIIIINSNKNKIHIFLNELKPWLIRTNSFCGVSYPFENISSLRDQYYNSNIAIEYGNKENGAINHCQDHALNLIFNILKSNTQINITHPALDLLIFYDKKNNSQLYNTLNEYLINERNHNYTAIKLSIHRNSLSYRLKRIKELINLDLDDPNIRMHLLLSYKIKELK